MTKALYIHAGAHRTGSSSFQLCLSENRAALQTRGFDVAYPRRDGIPGGHLRMRLPRPRDGANRVPHFAECLRAHLQDLSTDPKRPLILSEENIPGRMLHFYEGRFYPAAAKRLRALAAAVDGPPASLLYVLRPYAALFVSAYRKRAEDNPVPPFSEIVPKFMGIERGWPELLAEIHDILRPARFTVLPYDRRGQSRDLLARLVPQLASVDLVEPAQKMNLSATDVALQALQARYRAGERLPRSAWRQVIADHAEDREPRGFAAFAPREANALQARYERDLDRLAALPGLTLA